MLADNTIGDPSALAATEVTASETDSRLADDRFADNRYGPLKRGLAYGLLLLTLAVSAATIIWPSIIGAIPLSVLSDSMAPRMPIGSLAIVHPTMDVSTDISSWSPAQIRLYNDVSAIEPGDIVVFQPNANDPTLVMHRVMTISTTGAAGTAERQYTFVTRGDNLAVNDQPISDYQIRGVVRYSLPLIGYVNTWLNAGPNAHWSRIVVATAGFVVAVFYFGKALFAGKAQ